MADTWQAERAWTISYQARCAMPMCSRSDKITFFQRSRGPYVGRGDGKKQSKSCLGTWKSAGVTHGQAIQPSGSEAVRIISMDPTKQKRSKVMRSSDCCFQETCRILCIHFWWTHTYTQTYVCDTPTHTQTHAHTHKHSECVWLRTWIDSWAESRRSISCYEPWNRFGIHSPYSHGMMWIARIHSWMYSWVDSRAQSNTLSESLYTIANLHR